MVSSSAGSRPRALLLGAGHAHLYTLRRAAAFSRRGFELTLVAPENFWYSGLATGVLGGHYPPSLDQIDVDLLAHRGGGRFVRDRVMEIDVVGRTVRLESGDQLAFDVLSLNLGSEVPLDEIAGAEAHGYSIKPIKNLWQLRQDLLRRLESAQPAAPLRLVVIGGGATGCEIAANAENLVRNARGAANITLLVAGERLLEQFPWGAARRLERALRERGIEIRYRTRVESVAAGKVSTTGDGTVAFDLLVYATGLRPHPLLRSTGLPVDRDGALIVDSHLRSIADPRIHGGGDCITLQDRALPKIGVFAIREGPVLFHNIFAALERRPPRSFEPQKRWLLILNLGDGTGLAAWDRFWWFGRLAFRLKDQIDRRFLSEYNSSATRVI